MDLFFLLGCIGGFSASKRCDDQESRIVALEKGQAELSGRVKACENAITTMASQTTEILDILKSGKHARP